MSDDGISAEVKAFIQAHISSVEQLEVLLLLSRDPSREWDAASLSKELYISPESAASRLEDFYKRGFVRQADERSSRFCYRPNAVVPDSTVRELSMAYEQRRVRVINLIFSNPIDHLRSFADAFKLKKDKDDE